MTKSASKKRRGQRRGGRNKAMYKWKHQSDMMGMCEHYQPPQMICNAFIQNFNSPNCIQKEFIDPRNHMPSNILKIQSKT